MKITKRLFCEFTDDIRQIIPNKREYVSLTQSYSNLLDQFISSLHGPQKAAALELEAQRNMIAAIDEESIFCQGFKIGVQLMLEILYSNPNINSEN